jgi:hypothetical protein
MLPTPKSTTRPSVRVAPKAPAKALHVAAKAPVKAANLHSNVTKFAPKAAPAYGKPATKAPVARVNAQAGAFKYSDKTGVAKVKCRANEMPNGQWLMCCDDIDMFGNVLKTECKGVARPSDPRSLFGK